MSIAVNTNHFEIDDIALVFHAFGHTVCWLRGRPGELIVITQTAAHGIGPRSLDGGR